jgi:hypothetical protein
MHTHRNIPTYVQSGRKDKEREKGGEREITYLK